jgi:hypothetical protein
MHHPVFVPVDSPHVGLPTDFNQANLPYLLVLLGILHQARQK